MKRAVITGATGMLGSALTRRLIPEGAEVFCIVRPRSEKLANIPQDGRVHVIGCDLADLPRLAPRIPFPCDAFFHFAWEGTSGESRNDAALQEKNIRYTLDAVRLAKELGCEVFVGAGSQAEYGRVSGNLSAHTPAAPESGYGIAKYAAGKLSSILSERLGIRHIWARILSVYGPRDGRDTMVMSCIREFLKGRNMSFTKGEQLWDYLYCSDAARAFLLMAEKGKNGAVYPLGSGLARPLRDYICEIRDLIDPSLKPGIGEKPYAPLQVMHLCADLSSLTRDTGFQPEVDFKTGIRNTIDWMKNQERDDLFPVRKR